ncbi:MAG: CaiB/BaiF CoA transferase family protein [Pontibacterium sp.]
MKPLDGLKVLDFSTLLPGPYATMMMADLGADVVRVESPDRADLVRNMSPQIEGQSAAFRYLNRGKRSVALDLKHADARAVIHQLMGEYDIVVEQFRPGVMKRLGLDYETLSTLKPDLIYCSVTGYGQQGEYAQRAGHDINFLALSGVASHMGRLDSGPAPPGIQVADVAAGSHPAVVAILAAVIQRDRTGKGAAIDISMADNSFALQALLGPGPLNGEPSPGPESHFLNGGGFYDFYATQDGRYMAVGSLEPQFKRRLLQTLDASELEGLNDQALKTALTERFKQKSFDECCALFAEADACVEPVLNIQEAAEHPAFQSRGLVQQSSNGEKQITPPVRFNNQPNPFPSAAPLCGENADEVLEQVGFTEEQVQKFRAAGLFG